MVLVPRLNDTNASIIITKTIAPRMALPVNGKSITIKAVTTRNGSVTMSPIVVTAGAPTISKSQNLR